MHTPYKVCLILLRSRRTSGYSCDSGPFDLAMNVAFTPSSLHSVETGAGSDPVIIRDKTVCVSGAGGIGEVQVRPIRNRQPAPQGFEYHTLAGALLKDADATCYG